MKFLDMIDSVICGDFLDIVRDIPDDSIDLVVTSPPYNLGIDYDVCLDSMVWPDYYLWCERWLKEIYRILKRDGRFCLVHYLGVGNKDFKETPLMKLKFVSEGIGFKYNSLIIWGDTTLPTLTAWGSWKSASAPYIQSPFEGILVLYKDVWKKLEKGEDDITSKEFVKGVSGFWKIAPRMEFLGVKTDDHPATFPLLLPLRCIRLLSYKEDLVLDPFAGVGTTGVAAKRSGRKYICVELSSGYCKVAEKKLCFENLL